MSTYRLSGVVVDRATPANPGGLRIEARDANNALIDVLGYAVTDADGRFTLELTEEDLADIYEGSPDRSVVLLVIKNPTTTPRTLAAVPKGPRWPLEAPYENVRIEVDSGSTGTAETLRDFVVRGTVMHAVTGPVAGWVQPYDTKVSGSQPLGAGRVQINARGRYRCAYAAADILDDKQLADIELRVFDAEDAGNLLGSSPVRCHAPPTCRIDVVFEGDSYRPTGHETLSGAIAPMLSGMGGTGAVDVGTLDDDNIARVACASGQSLDDVRALSRGKALADAEGLDAEVTYGLLRQGQSEVRDDLLAVPRGALRDAIQRAVSSRHIAPLSPEALSGALNGLRDAAAGMAGDTKGPNETANLDDIIGLTLTTTIKKDEFLQSYSAWEGPITEFWEQTFTTFNNTERDNTQLVLQLAALTARHLPLIAALWADFASPSPSWETLADLAGQDEQAWKDNWITALGSNLPYDASASGPLSDDKYAELLVRTFESAVPTTAIAAKVKMASPSSDLAVFFGANASFSFEEKRVAAFFNNGAVVTGIADVEGTKRRLQTMERLFKVTKRHSEMEVLMGDGLHSARAIARMGRAQFIAKYAGSSQLSNAENAAGVYDRAVAQAAATTQMMAMFHPRVAGPKLPFLAHFDGSNPPEGIVSDWAALFGSPDACACEHCRSVFSATAYLVDLLSWLGRFDAEQPGITAKNILLGGGGFAEPLRPDIGDTVLSCRNTNTLVPYIDLVIEILERRVAGSAHSVPLETQASADELRAAPEYLDTVAYDDAHLGGAIYPFTLPYSLWHHQARVYAQHLGVSRVALMEATQRVFRPTQIADCALWLRADLGLRVEEGRVTEWRDLSGFDHVARPIDAVARPRAGCEGGAPYVSFNGSSQLTIAHHAALDSAGPVTIVVVASSVEASAGRVLMKGDATTNYGVARATNESTEAVYTGGSVSGPSWEAATAASPSTAIVELDETSTTWRIDAVVTTQTGQSNTLTTNDADLVIGMHTNGTNPLNGRLHEIIIFDKRLHRDELARLEGYLAERYATADAIAEPRALEIAQERLELTRLQRDLITEWTPDELPGCALWLRADRGVTLSGAQVTSWANQGSLGGAFNPGSSPSFVASDPDWSGRPSIAFDGNMLVSSLPASAWRFLHDGTGCTVLVVARWTGGTSLPRLFSTGSGGGTQAGLIGYVNQSTHALVWACATGSAVLFTIGSSPVAPGTPAILTLRHGASASPQREAQLDGEAFGAGSYAGSPISGDPAETCRLGAWGGGSSPIEATMTEVIAFDRILSDEELERVHGYLERRYLEAPDLWGQTTDGWREHLLNAQTFLDAAGISYSELRELLDTSFMRQFAAAGQEVRLLPVASADPCAVASQHLVGLDMANLVAAWDAVHRFLRLVRCTGWPLRETDALLTALGGALTAQALEQLGDAAALMAALPRLSRVELASWWGHLESRPSLDRPSLYASLFLTTALRATSDAFVLDASGEPSGPGPLHSHRDHILAALRMTAADFAILSDASEARGLLRLLPALDDDELSLENLSRLNRVASFARAARMTIAEVRILQALSGLAPLEGDHATGAASPTQTRRFLTVRDKLVGAGLTVGSAHYLVRHLGAAAAETATREAHTDATLAALDARLAATVLATTPPTSPTSQDLAEVLTELLSAAEPERSADRVAADVATVVAIVEGRSVLSLAHQQEALTRSLSPFVSDLGTIAAELLFRPYHLAGCELWLEPSGIQDDGGRVTTWNNLAPTTHAVVLPEPGALPGCVLWLRADVGVTAAPLVFTIAAASAFDNGAWTKLDVTVTANDTTDPDSGSNADRVTEDVGVGLARHLSQTLSLGLALGVETTLRIRAKRPASDGVDFLWLDGGDTERVFFDLAAGEVALEEGGATGTLTALADGWYLCELSFTATASNGSCRIGLARAAGAQTYDVAVDDERHLWLYHAEVAQPALRVSAWSDQSGLNRHASQATPAARPTYEPFGAAGRPALFFDSRDVWLDLGTSTPELETSVYTLMGVASLSASTGNKAIWSNRHLGTLSGGTKTFFGWQTAAATWVYQNAVAPAPGVGGGSLATGVTASWMLTSDGSRRHMYLDGAETYADGVDASPLKTRLASGRISSDELGVSGAWHGHIAELVHFDEELDALQRAQLFSYASWRYTPGHAEPRVTDVGPFGLRAVALDGVAGWLPAHVSYASTSHTFIAVVRQESLGDPTTGMALLDVEDGALICAATAKTGSVPSLGLLEGASWVAHAPAVAGDQILTWVFDGDNDTCELYRGGARLGAAATYATAGIDVGGVVGIGGRFGSASGPFHGAIACAGLFSVALGDTDLARVHAYVSTLAGQIPVERYLVVLTQLLDHKRLRDSRVAIKQHLAATYDLTPRAAAELLEGGLHAITAPDRPLLDELLPATSNTPALGTWHTRRAALVRFAKAATVIGALNLSDALIPWLVGPYRDLGWLDLNELPTTSDGEASIDFTTLPVTDGIYDLPPWLSLACPTGARSARVGPLAVRVDLAADAARAQSRSGESFALLVEPAAVNFIAQQNLAEWTRSGVGSVTGDTTPSGATLAATVADEDHGSRVELRHTSATGVGSGKHTLSTWLQRRADSVPGPTGDGTTVFDAHDESWQDFGFSNALAIHGDDADFVFRQVTRDATATTAINWRIAPRWDSAWTGSIRVWGMQLEARAYPTSFIGADNTTFARAADVLSIAPAAVSAFTTGHFDVTLRYAPLYAHHETTGDHDLLHIGPNDRLYFKASTKTFVLVIDGDPIESEPVAFARHAVITLRATHTPSGRTLTVKGTSGDGTTTAAPLPALTWPAAVFVLGDHTGAQEGAELHALRLVSPTAPHDLEDARRRFAGLLRLLDLRALERNLARRDVALVDLFSRTVGSAALDEETFLSTLSADTGYPRADLDVLIASGTGHGLAYPADYRTEAGLLKVMVGLEAARQLGVTAADALSFADVEGGAAVQQPIAEAVLRAAKAKYEPAEWPAVGKSLRDELRIAQRDALVSHLVHTEGLPSSDALFEKLLVDAEMTPCMMTSRINLALSSVQTFVQRRMLGLDDDVIFDKDAREEWQWRKNYRVWEANRKVFLWPENWIEPELRDDKTPLFERLESKLRQADVTDETVEAAYRDYLAGLEEIADLKPVGMYQEWHPATPSQPSIDQLHVFAQTRGGSPRTLYYRKWIEQDHWTPWEHVPIDAASTVYLPVVEHGRLSLWWPTVVRRDSPEPSGLPLLQLQVSHFDQQRWSKPVVTSQIECGVNATARLAYELDTANAAHARVLVVNDEVHVSAMEAASFGDVEIQERGRFAHTADDYDIVVRNGIELARSKHDKRVVDFMDVRTVVRAYTKVDPCSALPQELVHANEVTRLHTARPIRTWSTGGDFRSTGPVLTMPVKNDDYVLFDDAGRHDVHLQQTR